MNSCSEERNPDQKWFEIETLLEKFVVNMQYATMKYKTNRKRVKVNSFKFEH